jgi:hypothetical protein
MAYSLLPVTATSVAGPIPVRRLRLLAEVNNVLLYVAGGSWGDDDDSGAPSARGA